MQIEWQTMQTLISLPLQVQSDLNEHCLHTVMIHISTDRCGQIVQTQIRLLLEEQSDLGLHCLQFRLHVLDSLLFGKAILFKF